MKTEILRKLGSVIRKYIDEHGTQNMFDKTGSDLKTAIKQKLRENYTIEQLLEEQISENVSATLNTYIKTHNIGLQPQLPELNRNFDQFFFFFGKLVDSLS